MKKLIILDRDGVINYDSPYYIKSVEEFLPIPGSIEAIALLSKNDYMVAIATNQSGVSRGLYSEETLKAIHKKLFDLVEQHEGQIAAIEYCIHLPGSGCLCRKPNSGMLIKLGQRLHYPLENTPFVGDRVSDIEAALKVGAKPIMILSPMTDRQALARYSQVDVFTSLSDYVNDLLVTK